MINVRQEKEVNRLLKNGDLVGFEKYIHKIYPLSKYNPTHETIKDCGGTFNKVNDSFEIICAKCGDTLLDYFDELAEIF